MFQIVIHACMYMCACSYVCVQICMNSAMYCEYDRALCDTQNTTSIMLFTATCIVLFTATCIMLFTATCIVLLTATCIVLLLQHISCILCMTFWPHMCKHVHIFCIMYMMRWYHSDKFCVYAAVLLQSASVWGPGGHMTNFGLKNGFHVGIVICPGELETSGC
jgi:hypothetical protein